MAPIAFPEGRQPGFNLQGVAPTAESLIMGVQKAQLPKVDGQ